MAVSHQWFIQWSEPSMVFADVTSKYQTINNWNNLDHKLSESAAITNGEDYATRLVNQKERLKVNRYYTDTHTSHKSKFGLWWRGKCPEPRNAGRIATLNGNAEFCANYGPAFWSHVASIRRFVKSRHRSKAASITLWLTMLGVAQPQSTPVDTETPPFSTLYKWKYVDFEFPSTWHREYALESRKFVPENVLPLGLEVWGSRVWVTLPSWRRGVPATLATLPRAGGLPSPPLKPYPDWSFHRAFRNGNNCSGLTSVFRVNADSCGRLWVLDSGQIDAQDNPKQVCPPSIVVFDLESDKLLARYSIPQKYVLQDSLYSNIIVDTRTEDCSDLHVYLADTWRFGLLVFRESDETFWRFSNPLFYPDPLASNFTLHGLNFQWADGIFGLGLSPVNMFGDRILFFNSLASYREFFVYTSVLQEPSRVNDSATEFHLLGESRGLTGQASASAIDRRGVMFYGLVMRDSVGCWDMRKFYNKRTQGVVASNRETIVFPNDIKVDQEVQQSVWVITNRLPMFQAKQLDDADYNYRILYADTEEAVRGTVCDPDAENSPPRRMDAIIYQ